MTRILEVDPRDDGALRAWYDVLHAGAIADRTAPIVSTYPAMAYSLRYPGPTLRRLAVAADEGGQSVGALLFELLETTSHPDHTDHGAGHLTRPFATGTADLLVPAGGTGGPAHERGHRLHTAAARCALLGHRPRLPRLDLRRPRTGQGGLPLGSRVRRRELLPVRRTTACTRVPRGRRAVVVLPAPGLPAVRPARTTARAAPRVSRRRRAGRGTAPRRTPPGRAHRCPTTLRSPAAPVRRPG